MGRHFLPTIFCTALCLVITCQLWFPNKLWGQTPFLQQEHTKDLSLKEATEMMYSNNYIIRQSAKGIEMAIAEKQKLNSSWYPFITAGGSFIHMSNDIEAKESLTELVEPFKEALPELGQIAETLLPILGKYGLTSLDFPLLEKNLASIDATMVWPLFTGGKRIYANRIGKSIVTSAKLLAITVEQSQMLQIVERYYAAKLAREIVDVQIKNLTAMQKLYTNSRKLMENGIINKAEMLAAKVAWQEAVRELDKAKNNDSTSTEALKALIWSEDSIKLSEKYSGFNYTTPFFMCSNIPSGEYFKNSIDANNPQLQFIENQKDIAGNKFKIERSRYMPDIAVFGKQNLYSYNIPENLSPRSVAGVGFAWNIFDGLNREKSMKIVKKELEILDLSNKQLKEDLHLLSDKLYYQLDDAMNNLTTINTTIELAEELVKIREKSLAEGMATTADVINAHATLAKIRIAAAMAYFQYDISLATLLSIAGMGEKFSDYRNNADIIL